jgi:hypothetical protein
MVQTILFGKGLANRFVTVCAVEFPMRLVKTFVLHVYVDSDDPERLCGELQRLPDRKNYPFKTYAELLGLLRWCAAGIRENDREGREPGDFLDDERGV